MSELIVTDWVHDDDGTPCEVTPPQRAYPDTGNLWWCTEHQQHIKPKSDKTYLMNKSSDVVRWADAHQYRSEPMPEAAKKGMTVTLLNALPDPLGSLAALCGIYEGRVIRNLNEVTDEQRRQAFKDMMKTTLNGPLAGIHLHFLIEGVSRSFTHQAVRDNFSFIAQESLRFAVKEDWVEEVHLPPFLAGLPSDDWRVVEWESAIRGTDDAYTALVNSGMPAEEARELLPHAVTTRYHWTPSLRTLMTEAGKRTCTQAQFHWKQFFAQVAKALRGYSSYRVNNPDTAEILIRDGRMQDDNWQFNLIADRLRPNCFQTGSCGFMAQFDRGCTIRERVEANAKSGRPVAEWGKPSWAEDAQGKPLINAIDDWEWAADPAAARKRVL